MNTYVFTRSSGEKPRGEIGEEVAHEVGTVGIFDALQRLLFRLEGEVSDGIYDYRTIHGSSEVDRGSIVIGHGGVRIYPRNP